MTAGDSTEVCMLPTTDVIWGKRELQRCWTEDYVAWAVGLLETGRDSKNLRILASLEPRTSVFEAEEHFLKAARELSLSQPSSEDAIRLYCIAIARQILNEEIPLRGAVKKLCQICCARGYPRNLMVWADLDDGCDAVDHGDRSYLYPRLRRKICGKP